MALSVTKWIHLNWGDIGIKRFFKKVYRHLKPGGKFIVEPQPFSSYSKKKKLTVRKCHNRIGIGMYYEYIENGKLVSTLLSYIIHVLHVYNVQI